MDTHVKVIGWLWIVLGVMGLLAALCVVLATAGGGLISGDRVAITVTSIVSAVVGGFLLLISIPNIIVGIGLLKFKSWARILAIVLGILNLFSFPFGTALGIYTLIIMFNQETPPLFESVAEV